MSWLSLLQEHRAIAVIRAPKKSLGEQMALAVASGGMRLIEITWNSDGAAELINQLRCQLPDCVIGTGTLFNVDELKMAIACGAEFLFTPHTDPEMIRAAVVRDIPIIPGALTPTEIMLAWQRGASSVKVFPVEALGGATYIKSLHSGPMAEIPLIPTGGVTLENAQEFLQAGAVAVGLSSELFPQNWLSTGNWAAIAHKAQNLTGKLNY